MGKPENLFKQVTIIKEEGLNVLPGEKKKRIITTKYKIVEKTIC